MLRLRSASALLVLLWASAASAHPFLDVQPLPLPPPLIPSGTNYQLVMLLYPGDTPVVTVQLDFELSSNVAFLPLSNTIGEGFTLSVSDSQHFSVTGDFTENPLEAFGVFVVGELHFLAAVPGGTLSLLDSSRIVATLGGVPDEYELPEFSNVFSNEIAEVVPEPSAELLLGAGLAALGALSRRRRR